MTRGSIEWVDKHASRIVRTWESSSPGNPLFHNAPGIVRVLGHVAVAGRRQMMQKSHYNPDDPSDAVLMETSGGFRVMFGVGLLCCIFAGLIATILVWMTIGD